MTKNGYNNGLKARKVNKNMQEYKIYCDHCGKELDTMKDYNDTLVEIAYHWFNTDLCSDCLEELYDTICKFCER